MGVADRELKMSGHPVLVDNFASLKSDGSSTVKRIAISSRCFHSDLQVLLGSLQQFFAPAGSLIGKERFWQITKR